VRTSGDDTTRIPAAAIKGAILGLTAASLLGVPTQSLAVTLTFWIFACWYLTLAVPVSGDAQPVPGLLRHRGVEWALIAAIVLAQTIGTAYAAEHRLNVPERARRFGWNYEHGFFDAGPGPEASRYAAQHAVAVVPVEGRVLVLKLWTDDPGTTSTPVAAKVWVDGKLVLDTGLRQGSPVSLRIRLPSDQGRLIIRTSTDRTWKITQPGPANGREAGLALDRWTFEK
jgi:hypothetical protein